MTIQKDGYRINNFDSEESFIKLEEQLHKLIDKVISLENRFHELEKKFRNHKKDEFAHTWEQDT